MKQRINIMWFRRDLRLNDNAAFFYALKQGIPVLPLFIFDRNILDDLEDKDDARLTFIHAQIESLKNELKVLGSGLMAVYGFPLKIFEELLQSFEVETVFTNHDYEQYAIDRDRQVAELLKHKSIGFKTYKDQVIFEGREILKNDGTPFSVFTPYSKQWTEKLSPFYLKKYNNKLYFSSLIKQAIFKVPSLESMGFKPSQISIPKAGMAEKLLSEYAKKRDYPSFKGTSRLGVHLRFGTVSIRHAGEQAIAHSQVFLNELIWRDFYQMILANYEHVRRGESFKREYDRIVWRNNEQEFELWTKGLTGYPLVDAGIRELNSTGFMHNRVRMVTASFLTKHLLIDWRWGEAYFAKKLLDFDYASNNGGWQWAAGSGCDAAPYFRIFNPTLQLEKFDKDLTYVKQWVPELLTGNYPAPMVDHKLARQRALQIYSNALKN